MTSIPGEDLFLVFGLHSISATKCIISTKLFVNWVKAANASPHAKFYNLSTSYSPGMYNGECTTEFARFAFPSFTSYNDCVKKLKVRYRMKTYPKKKSKKAWWRGALKAYNVIIKHILSKHWETLNDFKTKKYSQIPPNFQWMSLWLPRSWPRRTLSFSVITFCQIYCTNIILQ